MILKIGDSELNLTTPQVMTIINVTNDSFYAGSRLGSYANIEVAVTEAIAQGATILDIGGYSSRPGADDIPIEEELRRVMLGVEVIRSIDPNIAISIDTFRANVADRVVSLFGACIINDISAGELDCNMIPTVAKLGVPYIAMHMRATPKDMQQHTNYNDIATDVLDYFRYKVQLLKNSGIRDIIIDPGFGFAKSLEQNYDLLKDMNRLLEFNLPILAGVSRKSMIYKVLGSTPSEALNGTSVINWEALNQGASILRVHDTQCAVEVVKLFNMYKNRDSHGA